MDRRRQDDPIRRLYKTARWKKLRKAQLAEHPLCQCPACGEGRLRVTPATVVDHDRPHRGDEALFFDPSNLVSMGKTCHDRKTARRDGGFGNARKDAAITRRAEVVFVVNHAPQAPEPTEK